MVKVFKFICCDLVPDCYSVYRSYIFTSLHTGRVDVSEATVMQRICGVSKTFGELYQIRGVRWTSFCFPVWRASWEAHILQTWRQSKNMWQRFCDRYLKRPLLTVSRSFVNVANSVLWMMAIILKANKVNLFLSSLLFVFWYHSPNSLDTPRTVSTLSDSQSCAVKELLLAL
jgi:hypothetical protein